MQRRPSPSKHAQESRALHALRLMLQQGDLQPHLGRKIVRPARHHELTQIALADQVHLGATCRTLRAAVASSSAEPLFRVQLPVAASRQETLRSDSFWDYRNQRARPTGPPAPGEVRYPPPEKIYAGPLQECAVGAGTRVMLPWAAKLRAAQGDRLFAFRFDPWEGLRMAGGPEGWATEQLSWCRLDAQLAELAGRDLPEDPAYGSARQAQALRELNLLSCTRWPGLRNNGTMSRRLALQWAFAVRFGLAADDPLVRRAPNIWRTQGALHASTLTVQPAAALVALVVACFVGVQLGRATSASAVVALALGVGFLAAHLGASERVSARTKRVEAHLAILLAGCLRQDEAFADLLFCREAPELDAHAFLRTAYPGAKELNVGGVRPPWPPGSHPSAPGYLATGSVTSPST